MKFTTKYIFKVLNSMLPEFFAIDLQMVIPVTLGGYRVNPDSIPKYDGSNQY